MAPMIPATRAMPEQMAPSFAACRFHRRPDPMAPNALPGTSRAEHWSAMAATATPARAAPCHRILEPAFTTILARRLGTVHCAAILRLALGSNCATPHAPPTIQGTELPGTALLLRMAARRHLHRVASPTRPGVRCHLSAPRRSAAITEPSAWISLPRSESRVRVTASPLEVRNRRNGVSEVGSGAHVPLSPARRIELTRRQHSIGTATGWVRSTRERPAARTSRPARAMITRRSHAVRQHASAA